MEGLWTIIDSLSTKNKKWLVDKLLSSLSTSKDSKEEIILTGIAKSAREVKSDNTQPIDTLWNQL